MTDGPAGSAQGTGQRWADSRAQAQATRDPQSASLTFTSPRFSYYGAGKEPFSTSLTTFIDAASLSHLDQSWGGGVKGREM